MKHSSESEIWISPLHLHHNANYIMRSTFVHFKHQNYGMVAKAVWKDVSFSHPHFLCRSASRGSEICDCLWQGVSKTVQNNVACFMLKLWPSWRHKLSNFLRPFEHDVVFGWHLINWLVFLFTSDDINVGLKMKFLFVDELSTFIYRQSVLKVNTTYKLPFWQDSRHAHMTTKTMNAAKMHTQ